MAYPNAQPSSTYFTDASHRMYFEQRRLTQIAANKLSRLAGSDPWTEVDELKLVDYLYRDWFGEPYHGGWTFDDLDLDKLEDKPLRRHELRPFKLNYETLQEVKLRLNNTVIAIKGNPFFVSRVHFKNGDFLLALNDGAKTWSAKLDDITDLRSIPPMYITGNSTGWLCRIPGRVYQQGLNRHNTIVKSIDGSANVSSFDSQHFMKTFNKRTTRRWDETLASLMDLGELPGLRLSDDVAVGRKSGKIMACYRGRALGTVKDNDIIVNDEDDLLQGWIERSVQEVGMGLRA